jgi:hypothetical protein
MLDETGKVMQLGLQQFISKETTPDQLVKKLDDANQAAWAQHGSSK